MKKFNVAKSVENEKKKSQPEKKIFYSLLMCVFAAALFTSFFSGKSAKKRKAGRNDAGNIKIRFVLPNRIFNHAT